MSFVESRYSGVFTVYKKKGLADGKLLGRRAFAEDALPVVTPALEAMETPWFAWSPASARGPG